jgi:peptidoglycan/xylan/chitin deacetylase (PgdA/CDA1 family)
MKVIISHDVDHLSPWEHRRDLFLPKFLVRNTIELFAARTTVKEYLLRVHSLIRNKWQNLRELMAFNQRNKVPATFFVAFGNGRSLAYPAWQAARWISEIKQAGFSVGLHGIEMASIHGMEREKYLFQQAAKEKEIGIRFHDIGLRSKDAKASHVTIRSLADLGYRFSSNTFDWRGPELIEGIYDFPVHIMDGLLFRKNGRWTECSFLQSVEETNDLLLAAQKDGIRYFQVLFHDVYFSRAYKDIQKWYVWLIEHLEHEKVQLIDFYSALKEMEDLP